MLSIQREDLEAREHQILSPEAAFSDQSKGRAIAEEPDQYRTCYQCDRDRILQEFQKTCSQDTGFSRPRRGPL